jgi:hypothetical protein
MAVSPSLATTSWTGRTARLAVEELVEPRRGAFPKALDRRPLERVLANVADQRHIDCDLGSGPPLRLDVELVFEVIHPHRPKFGTSEIEDFVAGGGAFALLVMAGGWYIYSLFRDRGVCELLPAEVSPS